MCLFLITAVDFSQYSGMLQVQDSCSFYSSYHVASTSNRVKFLHSPIEQIRFPNDNVLFLSLFSLTKN